MRYLTNRITSALLVLLLVALVSCDSVSGDPDLPIPLDETLENTGAFLRILSVETAAFDLADRSTAAYTIEVEYFDGEGSSLLQDVDFYAGYTSFALDPANQTTVPETADPFLTVPASAFTENENGNPQATISVPLTAVASALGLDVNNIGVEDRFDLRWVVNTTDGRSFSASDASAPVQGGFYSSPYSARVFTVQALDETAFAGDYLFEAQGTGVFGWQTFSSSFTTELSVDPDNTLNGRVFTAEPYAEGWGDVEGPLNPITVPIALGRTATATGEVTTGLGCTLSLAVGPITDQAANGVIINIDDDSQFTMVIGDNTRGACGTGPVDVAFTVTKQ
ncbi:MAG: hypothetical protein GVY02_01255 [Bacteroidetes bacterium]|jgi:hypothetical protein|nr:hypothetical protein [Bacteroidota bacterium]